MLTRNGNCVFLSVVIIYSMKRIALALAAIVLFAASAQARKVSGTVMNGELYMNGVVVTDGENFTTTNAKGKFTFEIKDDAEFVFIVTPSGYVADWTSGVPAFYQKAPGVSKFNFNLQKTVGGQDYNIIAMADPQMYSPEHFAEFEGAPLADLTATAKSLTGQTVGLALGDIAWDEQARLDDYKKAIVKTGVPFYPVVGNHDNCAWCEGDLEGSASYREKMGPENYAFFLGKDVVIVLDNIIYTTNFKANVGYADHVLLWVKKLMAYIPADADIYIAQHAPTMHHDRKITNANRLLDMVRGRKVTFLSGHTHVNNNFTIEKGITEHNIAAICGAWWDTQLCSDGTPKGYKVFTKFAGKLSWYYKAIGKNKRYIAEAFGRGETVMHPNSIVVNVWDWDPQWKVEWYEDGIPMDSMDPVKEVSTTFIQQMEAAYQAYGAEIPGWKRGRPSGHHFAATPSRYAKNVMVSVQGPFGQKWTQTFDLTGYVEECVKCPEGAVGFETVKKLAENRATAVAFDLHVGMDKVVRAGTSEGMVLTELIDSVDSYLAKAGRSTIRYNIEMHTVSGPEEGVTVPHYHRCADYIMDSLWTRFLGERLTVTGTDFRALNHLYSRYPEVEIAFKVGEDVENVEKALAKLKFTPMWLSFHYSKVDAELIKTYREKGYLISVWGIPDEETKNRIKALGPDAVIF